MNTKKVPDTPEKAFNKNKTKCSTINPTIEDIKKIADTALVNNKQCT